VESAMANRAPIERVVDRVSRVFVPVVVGVAVVTLVGGLAAGLPAQEALMRAIAVLVIACPCALGIATPLAITSAVGTASRRGILIRDSRVLEEVEKVDVVILDKTGTVTEGNFSVLESTPAGGDWLAAAAALETWSEHPLGHAVVRKAQEAGLAIPSASDVEVRKGLGLTGVVGAQRWAVGSRRLMTESGAVIEPDIDSAASAWEARGLTVAFAARDGVPAGAMAFGDRVRDGAAALVSALRARGVRTVLLSGDSRAATALVAEAIGAGDYRADVLPDGKRAFVERCREEGSVVAMVGDGVNDAPALAAANLGIALNSGADLAMQAAPVVLMSADLGRVIQIFDLSRLTLRVVRQNLFWAFAYNAVGISLAAAGVLTPILAAGAMVLSSLSVIGNSTRLR
jgi:heavy metal translocating P-type ATPase